MKTFTNLYALYKGEEFIDIGTSKELSDRYGITPKTVRFMSCPSYHKRAEGRNWKRTVNLEHS